MNAHLLLKFPIEMSLCEEGRDRTNIAQHKGMQLGKNPTLAGIVDHSWLHLNLLFLLCTLLEVRLGGEGRERANVAQHKESGMSNLLDGFFQNACYGCLACQSITDEERIFDQ